jgi:hypothetical protein
MIKMFQVTHLHSNQIKDKGTRLDFNWICLTLIFVDINIFCEQKATNPFKRVVQHGKKFTKTTRRD